MKSSFESIGRCAFALSFLWLTIATPCTAAARGRVTTCCSSCQKKECCTCTRELVTILWGGGTTLVALVVSLGRWYLSDFHVQKKKIIGCLPELSPFRFFLTFVGGTLVPQIFMAFVLSSALSATVLQKRVHKDKRKMAKRLSAMVVWIGVSKNVLDDQFKKHKSLQKLFTEHENQATTDQHNSGSAGDSGRGVSTEHDQPRAPDVQDALVLYNTPSGKMMKPTEHRNESSTFGYLCSEGWDPKNRLWKEAMLNTAGVLPPIEEVEVIESRTKWECAAVAIQSVGYLASIVSRFASGKTRGVSPVEIMSAWISVVLFVQVVIIPLLVTFCNRGLCLHLPDDKFDKLVNYYERRKEDPNDIDLTSATVWLFVLCLSFLFLLFLILIPALVYYFYDLPSSGLSFASLLLFAILSGIAIMVFVLTLIFPAQQVLFAFTAFPYLRSPNNTSMPPSWNDYMPVISSIILLLGLSAYTLAIADTVLNWDRFHLRDCYFSSIAIPHLGS